MPRRKRGKIMLNQSILMGRLVRDPEVRYTQGDNKAVTRFTLAVERDYKKDGEERAADFINCVAFGSTAEFIGKFFSKGSMLAVVGRIMTGSYTNKDGVKVYTTDVVIEKASFTGEKKADASPQAPTPDSDGFMEIPEGIDNELPFN